MMPRQSLQAGLEPAAAAIAKRDLVQFARGASTEITTHDESLLPALANKLPLGTTLYVAHTPKAALEDVVRVAIRAQSLGFRASPHIVARRLSNERQLRSALTELREADVEQVLLVAGDRDKPEGSFANTLDVLDSGAITDASLKSIGVAGHPQGNKAIGPSQLLAALKKKSAFAASTGLRMHIVTQFGFEPAAVGQWAAYLVTQGIHLPVHVGIAGPTPLPKLIKFAMQCGIGASLGSLMAGLSAMSHLAHPVTGPDEMMTGVLRARTGVTRIVSPHFYSFGGAMATAAWLRSVMDGRFELRPDTGKFSMTG